MIAKSSNNNAQASDKPTSPELVPDLSPNLMPLEEPSTTIFRLVLEQLNKII